MLCRYDVLRDALPGSAELPVKVFCLGQQQQQQQQRRRAPAQENPAQNSLSDTLKGDLRLKTVMFPTIGLKTKIGLGLLLSYSSYAVFVSIRTNSEISKRAKAEQLRLQSTTPSEGDNEPVCLSHNHDQYSSLTVAGRFENPFDEYRSLTLFEFFLSRILELFEGRGRGGVPHGSELRKLLPVHTPDMELIHHPTLEDPELPQPDERMTFTWLGQSCAFVQLSGLNILTDPLFSNYLVNRYLGPKRITPSACQLRDLPTPKYVLVSHNHPDHLDLEAADEIMNKSTWIVPLGIRKTLAKRGIYNTIEMDWWDRVKLDVAEDPDNVYEVACTPAMHWSGRSLVDSNHTLWCSFVVLKNGKPLLFHAGDTGYTDGVFKKISETYGPGMKLAMLPMGPYCPQWHQKPRHINPEECVKIMEDLKAKKMVGIHWGTFVLSSEHFLEPKLKLEQIASQYNKENDYLVPRFGQTMVFDLRDDDKAPSEVHTVRDGKSVLVK